MKYKITGTYEVYFDTEKLPQFSKGEMTESESEELFWNGYTMALN